MTTRHLSEEDLQQVALEPAASAPILVDHLQVCSHCRVRLRNYQLLFTQLKAIPQPTLDVDLASLVLAKIDPPKAARLESDWFDYRFGLGLAAGLGSVLYCIGKTLWLTLMAGSPMVVGLMLTTVVIVFGFLLLDQRRSHQRRMKTLSLY